MLQNNRSTNDTLPPILMWGRRYPNAVYERRGSLAFEFAVREPSYSGTTTPAGIQRTLTDSFNALGVAARDLRRQLEIDRLLEDLERAKYASASTQALDELTTLMAQLIRAPELFNDTALTKLRLATDAKLKTMAPQTRSIQLPVATRASGGSRVVTFLASSDSLDRHGTKVMPMGISTERYQKNPIVLFGHDGYGGWSVPKPENILGKTLKLRASEKRLEADVEFLPASVNPTAEMVFKMVKAGAVSAVSIGFIPREIRTEVDDNGKNVPVIVRSELLEISVVPIPSNPDALATDRSADYEY